MFSWVARIAVLVLVGGAINVVVAWGCVIWAAQVPRTVKRMVNPRTEAPGVLLVTGCFGYERVGIGDIFKFTSQQGSGRPRADPYRRVAWWPAGSVVFDRKTSCHTGAGWPFLSMRSRETPDPNARFLFDKQSETVLGGWRLKEGFLAGTFARPVPLILPLQSIWPNFAKNAALYAAALAFVFFAPGALRRNIRQSRGHCAACGYPEGTSPVCTECGASVRAQRVNVAIRRQLRLGWFDLGRMARMDHGLGTR